MRDSRGDGGDQSGLTAGGSFAIERGGASQIGQIGEGPGGSGDTAQSRNGAFRAGRSRCFGGACAGGGGAFLNHNGDDVIHAAGPEIGRQVRVSRRRRPERAVRGDLVGRGRLRRFLDVFVESRFRFGLFFFLVVGGRDGNGAQED